MQIITCNRGLLKQSLKDALKANAGTFEQVRRLSEPSQLQEPTCIMCLFSSVAPQRAVLSAIKLL